MNLKIGIGIYGAILVKLEALNSEFCSVVFALSPILEEFSLPLPEELTIASSEIIALKGIADSPQDLP